jgi:hypothetical protein
MAQANRLSTRLQGLMLRANHVGNYLYYAPSPYSTDTNAHFQKYECATTFLERTTLKITLHVIITLAFCYRIAATQSLLQLDDHELASGD